MRASPLELLARARHQAESLGNTVRALELAVEAWPRADAEARFHLRAFLRWLQTRLDTRYGASLRVEVGSEWLGPPTGKERPLAIGEAFCALVDSDWSGEAFVARLALEPEPGRDGPLPRSYGAELAEAFGQAELAVLRLLLEGGGLRPRAALLEGKRIALHGPPAGFVADGGSAGAAAATLLFSAWTETPPQGEVVLSGAIDGEGRLLPVEQIEDKVRAVLRERPWVRAVVVPAASPPRTGDSRVRPVRTVRELLAEVFGPAALARGAAPSVVDLEGTLRLGVELYEQRSAFPAALEVMGVALAAIEERRRGDRSLLRREEFLALWRSGSCLVHLGATEEADQVLGRARALGRALWERGEVNPQAYLGFCGSLAVLLRDVYRYHDAEALLLDTLQLQRELRQDLREQARTLGNLGELWTVLGRYDEAEAVLVEALEGLRAVYPDEVPREHCYLGNLALRQGDPRLALTRYRAGLDANQDVATGRTPNEAFLRLGMVRAHRALGEPAEAVNHADAVLPSLCIEQPYPRQLILRERGLARIALEDRDRGRDDLRQAADLRFARGALLRFGLGTAMAELARDLLAAPHAPEEHREALAWAARFGGLVAAVPGLPDRDRLAARIEQAARAAPSELDAALAAAARAFPY